MRLPLAAVLLALAIMPTNAQDLSPNGVKTLSPPGAIKPTGTWSLGTRAGDFVFVPSGTIHAIGAGISLLEFQQNSDVTYRLYDYGRPRELHLDDGVAVARPEPFSVCTGSGLPLSLRKRACMRRAWKAAKLEHDEISR